MIKRLTNVIVYTIPEQTIINSLPTPPNKSYWNRLRVVPIKDRIKTEMLSFQDNLCCYCGLELFGTSRPEIEHIADQARYTQFLFTEQNLAISCQNCNSSSKKGSRNVIGTINPIYSNCRFIIVHPYLDDPNDHYEWTNNLFKILIKHKSIKGQCSITIFELDSEYHTSKRAHELRIRQLEAIYNIPRNIINRVKSALEAF